MSSPIEVSQVSPYAVRRWRALWRPRHNRQAALSRAPPTLPYIRQHVPRHRRDRRDRGSQRQHDRPRQQLQPPIPAAVNRVPGYRASQRRAMHPDLMRPPRPRPQRQPTHPISRPQQPPLRHRALPRRVHDHPPAPGRRPLQQRRLHHPALSGRTPADHRPILLARHPTRERSLRRVQGRPPQRDHQAPGRVRIQPVRQPGPILPPRQQREETLHRNPAPRTRMDRQPRRLVENDDPPVLEQDRRHHTRQVRCAPPACGSRAPLVHLLPSRHTGRR